MENPKQIVGVKAEGKNWQSRDTVCEVLEADQGTMRYRTTFKDTGDVYESLWSPENPKVRFRNDPLCEDPAYPGVTVVRTWLNGEELPQEKAGGCDYRDHCLSTVLGSQDLYGEDYTGYEHNYLFRDGQAFERSEGDPDE